jgi:hypothetical protein
VNRRSAKGAGQQRDNSSDGFVRDASVCHYCAERATRQVNGLHVCYAHIGHALGVVQPMPAPEIEPAVSEMFDRQVAEYGWRLETALFAAKGLTIHLLRAAFWARQLGAEFQPWILEYLDRVLEQLHRIEPKSDREVAKIFELDLKNRRPQYDHRRDDLARAVAAYRQAHPQRRAQAFTVVADQFGVSEAAVRHAYYFFPENMR